MLLTQGELKFIETKHKKPLPFKNNKIELCNGVSHLDF